MEEEITIDKQSKIFFLVFFLLIASVIGFTYYRFLFAGNYLVEWETVCDPMQEACYVYECDPAAEECTGNPQEDTSYYKTVRRMAHNVPLCDPNDDGCGVFMCQVGESDCTETLCSEDTMIEGVECSDPEAYNAALEESAIEEDSTESESEKCAPEDTECAQEESATEEKAPTQGTAETEQQSAP